MDKTTQDLAWSVLPKEFKEEVKEIYSNAITCHPCGYNHKTNLLKYLFSYHNLTSDAEGEEMLTCEKYKVEEALNYCDELDSISGNNNMRNWGEQMIAYLFGSKCLPDEKDCATCQDITCKNYDTVNGHCRFIEHCSYEPKPVEPKADKHFDNIISRDFDNHNRLHIAAMAMAGLLANEGVSCFTDVQELEHMDFITYHALEYADKLIKKSKEDGED